METNWFAGCENLEAIKRRFRELATKHHPDHGGDEETMKAVNNAYEAAVDGYASRKWREAEDYRAEKYDGYERRPEPEWFREKVRTAAGCASATLVEVVGSWVWVTMDTRRPTFAVDKERLKSCGFRFSGPKKRWYYAPTAWRKRASGLSMDDIRRTYGSEEVELRDAPAALSA